MTRLWSFLSFRDETRSIREVRPTPVFILLIVALEVPAHIPTDYTQFTKYATFKQMRLGVPREMFFNLTYVDDQEIIDEVNAAILKIQSLGATIQDPADLPSVSELVDRPSEDLILR
jgi:Asp-tRNA(Asn)/Glu-tRNA(Gln) amidotransferase A subunit family amidase